MKKMVHVHVEACKLPGKATDILIPSGCGPDVAHISSLCQFYEAGEYLDSNAAEIHLEEGDPRIALVLELAEKLGTYADVEHYRHYSDEDRQNARLFIMSRSDEFFVGRGIQAGTKFNREKGCWNCGTGVQQTWYLRVRKKDLPTVLGHPAIATTSNEIMVAPELRQALIDAEVTGISFAEVHGRNENDDWVPITRDQILVEHIMPPIRGVFPPEGEKAACQECHRGGHQLLPEDFYRDEDLAGLQDFNLTWEWFEGYLMDDRLRECRPGRPEVLVTPKVMNIFVKARVTTFEWTPIGMLT